MASLQGRLLTGLATLVLAAGLAAGGLAFRWAFEEAIEFQDTILQQVGTLAVSNPLLINLPAESDADHEARVVIEEVGRASDRTHSSKTLIPSLSADLPDGFHTVSRSDEPWRLLLRTRPDGSRVAISQPTASRDEIARGSALRTILPLAALIPCLMLLVAVVIHYSFRPVSQLAGRLDRKQSAHLEKLPLDGMPKELIPFIASINRLLERLGSMIDQQRRFIADAAHELRTPITALSLQAENLDHADLSPEGLARLATLKTGIHRTVRLLEQLLDLARYEAGDASQAPLTAFDLVVKEVVADFQPFAQARSVDLGFACIISVSVRADATALSVLVRNLIDNALRHSPEGTRIDISLFCDGDRAVFRIEDRGPGILDTELERIFEPFFRGSRPESDGSGLGLSIARRIVDSHGGSIRLENMKQADRSGLRVTVALPVTDRAPQ